MKNSKNSLIKQLQVLWNQSLQVQRISKKLIIALFVIALIGFSDASYLTIEHYQNKIPPCTIGGCESVLSSSYSMIVGIPVSLLGAMFYATLLISLFVYFDTKKEIFLKIPMFLSIFGFLFSIYFVFLMIFIIKAFCQYCALSALTSTSFFTISLFIYLKQRKIEELS